MLKVCELEDRRQNSVDLQQCGLNGGCYDSRRKNELALERERERERVALARGVAPRESPGSFGPHDTLFLVAR